MVAITEAVSLEKQGEIGLLWIDNPPVNALGYPVRKGMADGIAMAMGDAEIKAIVVICKGRTFCAGADIREFGKPPKAPHLPDVLTVFDECTKPVVAAIHGTAFGGGLETALSSHFRVAVPTAQFGLPEVKLGLLPGAGGTQRLPRLIGPEKALPMIATGNPVGTAKALKEGLIDEIVEGDLAEGAVAFARKVLAENRPLRQVSAMNEKVEAARGKPEIFSEYRKVIAKTKRGFEAPEACVKAVEAAVHKPFAEGLAYERQLFTELMSGSQSAAQRYYFFAERQVAKIPDIPAETPQLDIKRVGIIGAGTMGGGITMNFVNVGIPVTLMESKQEFLDRGLATIRKNYEITASKGKMTAEEVEKRMGLITGTLAMEDLADVDLVIEAVYENMDLKKEIFAKLDGICKKDAILATNTSYLDVNEIAAQTKRPESVLGLHFFSPANVMRLLEVVRAEKTSKIVLATALALAKKIKKIAVVVGVCYGFAGNRMFAQRRRESEKLILEGALPSQVDKVVYEFGFPMGPFQLYDLIGNDLGWSKENSTGSTIRELLCEQGRFGLKAGKGFYNYEQGGRKPLPAPEVDQLIIDFSQKKGFDRRDISDEEILQRCVYPIINEGAKILEEKIAVRPSDLDVIWINGYGWPLYRGGPMFYADLVGLDKILAVMKDFQAKYGDDFKPAALLEQLVKEGKGFKDLN
ncbi:3-hydroxyacyl-CoA dehydrogenase NAD-binding domain-containing protein [Desulfatitalea alkaliphila]|uniref:3-hydroxyacyl-CoA dehydrogenase NAD-binding domain-containing protein n=1 Tax=Desulfatitalea alkaliphila TaxID=2929485 RepID=A0AA41R0B0_9BACT|nr:3-hydroxyacyl-CoA dehydrogenase NAD-binding domain-containing protein [Desulfatitalea alkaliphila]MCJ8499206.1 3-hydroxyacyl-CoA dehydrogenase NAD-binding domain-containing protein [Desulfatitalea alkaliphila]